MKSWKTTIGGALSALGTSLTGIGVVPQLGGDHSQILTYVAMAGFLLSALGKFFAHLFSADNTCVEALKEANKENVRAIITGDTSRIYKEQSPTKE